jgi:hypothetical protein
MYVIGLNISSSAVSYNYLSDNQNYAQNFKATKTSYASIGAGYSYGNYSAEARLNLSRSILNNTVLVSGDYSNFSIIAGYKIF